MRSLTLPAFDFSSPESTVHSSMSFDRYIADRDAEDEARLNLEEFDRTCAVPNIFRKISADVRVRAAFALGWRWRACLVTKELTFHSQRNFSNVSVWKLTPNLANEAPYACEKDDLLLSLPTDYYTNRSPKAMEVYFPGESELHEAARRHPRAAEISAAAPLLPLAGEVVKAIVEVLWNDDMLVTADELRARKAQEARQAAQAALDSFDDGKPSLKLSYWRGCQPVFVLDRKTKTQIIGHLKGEGKLETLRVRRSDGLIVGQRDHLNLIDTHSLCSL